MDGDIELEIGPGSGPGEYAVRVVRAPSGGHASGTFDLDVESILARRGDLEATVLASAASARRQTPIRERPVRQVGQQLFQALFSREVYGTYRASLGAVQQSGQQLRMVLRLGAPQLAALPWEMLFDPETESYLCHTEPLLRHVPAPDYHLNPLEVEPPLRVLGVVASPRGLPALDVDTEKAHLAKALAGPVASGRIELAWVEHATWDEIHEKLLAGPWHVLHFIGHGDYDTYTDEGQITLIGADGRADSIEASRFVDLISTAQPVPRLVVLNSCYSGRSGEQDLFSGTAAALVHGGINAVAAMQFTVSDVGAVAFAHGFYAALANGRSIDEAARNGRISIRGRSGGTLEWVTPVLYVRGGSTELFALAGPPAPQLTIATQPASGAVQPDLAAAQARRAQLHALYAEACGELRRKHYRSAIELLDRLLTLEPDYRDAAALRIAAGSSEEASSAVALQMPALSTSVPSDIDAEQPAPAEKPTADDGPPVPGGPATHNGGRKERRVPRKALIGGGVSVAVLLLVTTIAVATLRNPPRVPTSASSGVSQPLSRLCAGEVRPRLSEGECSLLTKAANGQQVDPDSCTAIKTLELASYGLECSPPTGNPFNSLERPAIYVYGYTDAGELNKAFDFAVSEFGAAERTAADPPGWQDWVSGDGTTVKGRILGASKDGANHLIWNDVQSLVEVRAESTGADVQALLDWWKSLPH